ncbi:hypothetical protein WAE56_13025 [Iodobacter sp. LRB]|uniref:hypothetical protein n=1 Tax=unclassified Iodobacter TaxID=235634 RepID=UPI000C119C31|nr:hypothetical protein [Iodobacter sp. BJB302]PHV02115.1 hypothetical protein CSQ88_08800 [Iodobacter sp. BJB302]
MRPSLRKDAKCHTSGSAADPAQTPPTTPSYYFKNTKKQIAKLKCKSPFLIEIRIHLPFKMTCRCFLGHIARQRFFRAKTSLSLSRCNQSAIACFILQEV